MSDTSTDTRLDSTQTPSGKPTLNRPGRRIFFYLSLITAAFATGVYLWPPNTEELYLIVDSEGKYGYVTPSGRMAIEPQWKWAGYFDSEGMAPVTFDDNKIGWIGRDGHLIIPPFELGTKELDFNADGMLKFYRGKRFGWMDRSGKVVIEPEWDTAYPLARGDYIKWVRNSLSGTESFRACITDRLGNVLLPARDNVDYREEPFFPELWQIYENGATGWIDSGGNEVIPPSYSHASSFDREGMASVYVGGRLGWIDREGKVVVPMHYSESKLFDSEGMAAVKRDGLWGWVDRSGREIIPPRWHDVGSFGDGEYARVLLEDYANEGVNILRRRWGLIDRSGAIVLPPKWKDVRVFDSDGMAAVKDAGQWGWIDTTGEVVIPPAWSATTDFDEFGMAAVCNGEGKWGWIDRRGNYLIEPQWDKVSNFDAFDMAQVFQGGSSGWVNRSGELIIPIERRQFIPFESEDVPYRELLSRYRELGYFLVFGTFGSDNPTHGVMRRDGKEVLRQSYLTIDEVGDDLLQFRGLFQSALINLETGRKDVLEGGLTPFDSNGYAWRCESEDLTGASPTDLVDMSERVIISLDAGWQPVILREGLLPDALNFVLRTMFGLFDHRWGIEVLPDADFYSMRKTVEPGRLKRWSVWFSNLFRSEPLPPPEQVTLCHCYDTGGKLIWSSAWVSLEAKALAVLVLALIMAVAFRPKNIPHRTRK